MGSLTGNVEWWTPRVYLDAAVAVMGAIDLDPASSEAAQRHVKATRYYTVKEDGRQKPWYGRVWCNPPYAMPLIRDFVARMVRARQADDIEEGILLVNAATDTGWFHMAAAACSAICLTRGRIRFLRGNGDGADVAGSPTHGQAMFYFGDNVDRFVAVFGEFGLVVARRGAARRRLKRRETGEPVLDVLT